jgi:hypothetical protein
VRRGSGVDSPSQHRISQSAIVEMIDRQGMPDGFKRLPKDINLQASLIPTKNKRRFLFPKADFHLIGGKPDRYQNKQEKD